MWRTFAQSPEPEAHVKNAQLKYIPVYIYIQDRSKKNKNKTSPKRMKIYTNTDENKYSSCTGILRILYPSITNAIVVKWSRIW